MEQTGNSKEVSSSGETKENKEKLENPNLTVRNKLKIALHTKIFSWLDLVKIAFISEAIRALIEVLFKG